MTGKFRNIKVKIKDKAGKVVKTRIQRAMVLASGKLKFVKNLSRSRAASPRHTTKKHRIGGISMARKKHHGGGKSITRELEKLGSLIALGAPAAEVFLNHRTPPVNWIVARYTGYSIDQGAFQWNRLVEGWGPFVTYNLARVAAHKLLGIIRKV